MKVLCLIADKLTASHCSTCNPGVPPHVSRTSMIQPHRCHHNACRASIPLCCPFMIMACVLHPSFPQAYAVLSIPGALCISCHDWSFFISVYFPFIMQRTTDISSLDRCPPLPTSSFQGSLCPTICGVSRDFSLPGHSVFIFLPFSWMREPSGCMPRMGKIGKKREGDTAEVEHTTVAAFATCITWALCILCCSSSCPNRFFPLIPRTCLLESLSSGR